MTDKPFTDDVLRRLDKVVSHGWYAQGRRYNDEGATLVLNLDTYLKVKRELGNPDSDEVTLGGFPVEAGTPMNKDHLVWYVIL